MKRAACASFNINSESKKNDLLNAMDDCVVAKGGLMGKYQRIHK